MSDLYKLREAFHDDLTYTAKELSAATRRHRQQDRGQFAGLAHRATAETAEFAGRVGSGMVRFHAGWDEVEAGSASLRVARPVYPRRC